MNINDKLMCYVYFHNSCTHNGDHLLLIKAGNACKQRMLPQTITNIFLKCKRGTKVQNDGGGQTVLVFTITKINYLVVDLFCDLARPLSYLYL